MLLGLVGANFALKASSSLICACNSPLFLMEAMILSRTVVCQREPSCAAFAAGSAGQGCLSGGL